MKTVMRNIVAVVSSLAAWVLVFFATAFALSLLWPEYQAAMRHYRETGEYAFTTGMLVYLLVCWMVTDFLTGLVCSKIAVEKRLWMAPTLLILGYSAYLHFYTEWEKLPWWYNFGVVLFVVPFAYLGSRVAAKRE